MNRFKNIGFPVDEELYIKLKLICLKKNISLKQFLTSLIEREVNKEEMINKFENKLYKKFATSEEATSFFAKNIGIVRAMSNFNVEIYIDPCDTTRVVFEGRTNVPYEYIERIKQNIEDIQKEKMIYKVFRKFKTAKEATSFFAKNLGPVRLKSNFKVEIYIDPHDATRIIFEGAENVPYEYVKSIEEEF